MRQVSQLAGTLVLHFGQREALMAGDYLSSLFAQTIFRLSMYWLLRLEMYRAETEGLTTLLIGTLDSASVGCENSVGMIILVIPGFPGTGEGVCSRGPAGGTPFLHAVTRGQPRDFA